MGDEQTAEEVLALEYGLADEVPAPDDVEVKPEVETPAPGSESPPEEAKDAEPEVGAVEAPPAPVTDPRDAELASLRAAVASQTEAISRLLTKPASPTTQAAPAAPPERVFALQVPDEMVDALGAEDPRVRKQAMEALVNGTAELTRKQILAEIMPKVQEIVQARIVSHASRQSNDDMTAKDFYTHYPELDVPALRDTVVNVATEVAQSRGLTQWSPELRDLIGRTVRERLQAVVQKISPQPVSPGRPASARPPKALGTGTRGPVGASTESMISDLLGL